MTLEVEGLLAVTETAEVNRREEDDSDDPNLLLDQCITFVFILL
jgi:hypothetical protein